LTVYVIFFRERRQDADDYIEVYMEPSQSTKENVQSVSGKKKVGRPAILKEEFSRSWTDEETKVLIEVWAEHENLYNTKHKDCFNRNIRQKSLTSMENTLIERDITANVKQISKKITDLKNYYGSLRRMIESSKSSGGGTEEVYVSPWKFYESLEFLSDAFTPRKTKSNANEDADSNPPSAKVSKKLDQAQTNDLHKVMTTATIALPRKTKSNVNEDTDSNPPSAKVSKKLAQDQTNELHKVMTTATTALQSVISKKNEKPPSEDADDTFGKLLIGQLRLIPDCDLKDDLKINLQQMILQCKRQVNPANARQSQTTSVIKLEFFP